MKIGSLFDGSGGFPLAATMCGIEPVWASEIEPYPIAVTCSRFPNMKHLGSVTDIKGDEVEPVDIISFGSPCQDLSVAGKRAGLKHTENGDEETTRSGLFMEAIRIIKEMRSATNGEYPRYAIWENVPGAFSSNRGLDFRVVLEEFIRIAEPTAVMPDVPKAGWAYSDVYCGDGWSLAYRVLDAQHWGVPQRRRRIYLVADFRGKRAGKILFEREGLRGNFAQGGAQREEVAGDVESGTGTADFTGSGVIPEAVAYGISSYESNSMKSANPHSGIYVADTSRTLDLNGGNPACNQGGIAVVEPVPHTLKIRGGVEVDSAGKAAGKGALIQNNLSATLGVSQDQYLFQPVKEQHLFENHSQDARYKGPLDVCPMLPAQLGTGGNNQPFVVRGESNANCKPIARVRYIVRRLTPTECARLQGFPDNWGHPDTASAFTDKECRFWVDVRNTHAAINGKAVKEYTKEQMLTWYNKLHTDSSEYKMWGNGIALPCALYVMQSISEGLNEPRN